VFALYTTRNPILYAFFRTEPRSVMMCHSIIPFPGIVHLAEDYDQIIFVEITSRRLDTNMKYASLVNYTIKLIE
jgi:hypothetical protein